MGYGNRSGVIQCSKPFSTTAEFVERGVASLKDVDPFFGECISKMNTMGRLDLESRLGKAPGGYNMPLPGTGIPFVESRLS